MNEYRRQLCALWDGVRWALVLWALVVRGLVFFVAGVAALVILIAWLWVWLR